MLGAMPRQADRVRFLEGIGPDQGRGYLSGDHHHGDRIHIGIGDTGYGIGRARPAGYQHDPGLAGGTGISFRSMRGARFVTYQNMPNAVVRE